MSDQLFLCFFGDGPFWRDFVLAPGYPSGFSYIWPFRYDDKWVQPALQTELSTAAGRTKLENTEAILCARFGNPHDGMVLPLRKVMVTHVDTSAGLYSFYFRSGPLVDVQLATELSTIGIPIPPSDKAAAGSFLAFRCALATPAVVSTDPAVEDNAWATLCQLISRESVLPVNPQAKRSFFLRFGIPSVGLQSVPIECLYKSEGQGPVYGAVFQEGQVYEVTYSHRIPWLERKNTTVAEIPIDYRLPTSSVELNSPTGSVIGNYQVTHISVSAIRSSRTWEELVIAPRERELTSQNGDKINAFDVKIPFKVKVSILHQFRTKWVWVLSLWLALTLLGMITTGAQLIKDIADGKAPDLRLYFIYIPLIAVASALVAVATFLLQEKVKDKVKSR